MQDRGKCHMEEASSQLVDKIKMKQIMVNKIMVNKIKVNKNHGE